MSSQFSELSCSLSQSWEHGEEKVKAMLFRKNLEPLNFESLDYLVVSFFHELVQYIWVFKCCPPDDLNSQSTKALDFVWITLLSPFLLHALSSDWRNDSAQKTESSLAVAQHKSMDSKLSILQSCSDGYFNNTYYSSVILLLVLLQPKLLL